MTIGLLFSIFWDLVKSLIFSKHFLIIVGVLVALKLVNKKAKMKKGRFL
jgi:hypothetical protein